MLLPGILLVGTIVFLNTTIKTQIKKQKEEIERQLSLCEDLAFNHRIGLELVFIGGNSVFAPDMKPTYMTRYCSEVCAANYEGLSFKPNEARKLLEDELRPKMPREIADLIGEFVVPKRS